MAKKNRHDDVVGLDIGAGELKVAVVREDQALRIGHARIPEGVIVDGQLVDPNTLAAELRRLWRRMGLKSRMVNFSIGNRKTHFRLQAVPRSNDPDDIHLILTTGAEIWFPPLTLDQMVIDYAEQQAGAASRIDLEVVAAEKAMVQAYVRALRRARLVPVACQYGPLIESRALAFPRSLTGSHVLVNIGAEKTSFVAVNGLDVVFSRLIDLGGNDFTRAIMERLSLPFDAAEKLKVTYGLNRGSDADEDLELVSRVQEALLTPSDRLVQNLADMRAYYERQPEGRPTEGITVIGGGARLSGLKEQIARYLDVELTPLRPQANFDVVPDLDLYAGAVGLGWQRPMSLLPATNVGSSDKGPKKSKVDRRKAQRVSRKLRRRQAAANPFLVWSAIGFVGFLGMFMWGNKLKSGSGALANAPTSVPDTSFVYQGSPDAQAAANLLVQSPPLETISAFSSKTGGIKNLLISSSGGGLSIAGDTTDVSAANDFYDTLKSLPGMNAAVDVAPATTGSGASFQFTLRRKG